MNESFQYNSLIDILNEAKKVNKGIKFIYGRKEEKDICYYNFYQNAIKILYGFQQIGIESGDEVVIQLECEEDFLTVFWACLLGKIIPIPLALCENEEQRLQLDHIINILKKPYIIKNEKTEENEFVTNEKLRILYMEDFWDIDGYGKVAEVKPSDIAYVQFSSGSTGSPKGIVLTHENILIGIQNIIDRTKTNENDRTLTWMPLCHSFGMVAFHLISIYARSNQFIMPTKLFMQSPELWIEKLNEHKITISGSPNFGYKHALAKYKDKEKEYEGYDLSKLRILYNGGEGINISLMEEFYSKMSVYGLKRNLTVLGYGLSETVAGVAATVPCEEIIYHHLDRNEIFMNNEIKYSDENYVTFADSGYPLGNCLIRICDENDAILKEKHIGHIQVKGKNVTSGYYGNFIDSNDVFTQDGWLKTGDMGFLKDGKVTMLGRIKEMIIINGKNYYPNDIERIAAEACDIEVAKIVACGILNKDTHKEDIVIFIETEERIRNLSLLAENIKKNIYKKTNLSVKAIIPIQEFPKTASTKIQRYKLIQMYEEGQFNIVKEKKHDLMHKNEIQKKLIEIWEEILEVKDITINDNFFDLGGTSLEGVYIAAEIEKQFNIEIPFGEPVLFTTVKAQETYINMVKNFKNDILKSEAICFNKKSNNKIFVFPPQFGYGVAYNQIASLLERYSLHCFNFLDKENIIEFYADAMCRENGDDNYVLMGYSIGGNLAFELSKELIKRGKNVSDLICIDSKVIERYREISYEEIKNSTYSLIDEWEPRFKEYYKHIKKVYEREKIFKNNLNYAKYASTMINDGVIDTNIHLVLSEETRMSQDIQESWKRATKKNFIAYDGVGIHSKMLTEKNNVESNGKIIEKILNEIFKNS